MASITPRPQMSLADKLSVLDKIAEKTNKKYGKTITGRIGHNPEIEEELTIKFIPTPSVELNAAVGGGFPRRRMTLIAGKSDSGKTSIVLETIAQEMRNSPDFVAAWLESESSLEKDYITETFGIDPDRFFFVKFDASLGAEEALDIVHAVLSTGAVDLFCINSLKCLVPTKEIEATFAEHVVALQARMNARMARKFTSVVAEHNTAFVIVTHLTTELGSMARDPLIVSGGNAIQYWSALTLDFRRQSIGPGDLITKEDGIKVSVTVKKNHCTPSVNPYRRIAYYAIFGEGIEQYLSMLEQACNMGFAQAKGAWVYWMDDNGEIMEKWNGKAAYRTYMIENPDKWKEFSDKVKESSGVGTLSSDEITKIEEEMAIIDKMAKDALEEEAPKTKKAATKKK